MNLFTLSFWNTVRCRIYPLFDHWVNSCSLIINSPPFQLNWISDKTKGEALYLYSDWTLHQKRCFAVVLWSLAGLQIFCVFCETSFFYRSLCFVFWLAVDLCQINPFQPRYRMGSCIECIQFAKCTWIYDFEQIFIFLQYILHLIIYHLNFKSFNKREQFKKMY